MIYLCIYTNYSSVLCPFSLLVFCHLHEDWSGASMFSSPFIRRQFIMALLFAADPKAIPVHNKHYLGQNFQADLLWFGDSPFISSGVPKDAFRGGILCMFTDSRKSKYQGNVQCQIMKNKTLKTSEVLLIFFYRITCCFLPHF